MIEKVIKKNIFPYDWFDSIEKFNCDFPSKKAFKNVLNSKISKNDWNHAYALFKSLSFTKFKEWHDLYLICDVYMLSDILNF